MGSTTLSGTGLDSAPPFVVTMGYKRQGTLLATTTAAMVAGKE